jgi:hypothetical protein
MARLKEMAAYLGLASRPKRYVKAFFACLGIFFLFSIFIYFAGLLDGGGSLTTRNGVRVAFILAVIWTWLTVMKGERKVLADFVPGLRSQAHRERKAVEKTRVNKEWELQQLEQRLAELQDSIATLRDGGERLAAFKPEVNEKLRCPRCWVRRGIHSDLRTNRSEDFDRVKCGAQDCGFVLSAP